MFLSLIIIPLCSSIVLMFVVHVLKIDSTARRQVASQQTGVTQDTTEAVAHQTGAIRTGCHFQI